MRGGAMLQRVTIFDTLDEEFIENLCQCDPEVLQQLIHMWGQCHSNQKRAERSTTQETVNPSVTIKTLIYEILQEKDKHKLQERKDMVLHKIQLLYRQMNQNQISWIKPQDLTGKQDYSVLSLSWLLVVMIVALELQASLAEDSNCIMMASRITTQLHKMPGFDFALSFADILNLSRIMQMFLIYLARVVGHKDRDKLIDIALKMGMDGTFLLSLIKDEASNEPASKNSTTSNIFDFYGQWLKRTDSCDALVIMHEILQKTHDEKFYMSFYIHLARTLPELCCILLRDLTTKYQEKYSAHSVHSRKFFLENLRIACNHFESIGHGLIHKLCCIAITETEAHLKVMALKIVTQVFGKVKKDGDVQLILRCATEVLVQSKCKTVVCAALRVFTLCLKENCMSIDDSKLKEERHTLMEQVVFPYIVAQIAKSRSEFDLNYSVTANSIRAELCELFSFPNLKIIKICQFLDAFRTGNQDSKQILCHLYRVYLGSVHLRQKLTADAKILRFNPEYFVEFERLMTMLVNAKCDEVHFLELGSVYDQLIESLTHNLSMLRKEESNLETLLVELIACVPTRAMECLAQKYVEVLLNTVEKVSELRSEDCQMKEINEVLSYAVHGLLSLLHQLPSRKGQLVKQIEGKWLSEEGFTLLMELFSIPQCQRDIIKLCYMMNQPQEIVFSQLAIAQEELFDDFKSLEIFLQLLGLVARENASYIATSESNIAAQVMDEESQPESSQEMDYMLNYKDSVVVKQCLQNRKEESITQGLLSAYLPFLLRLIHESSAHPSKMDGSLLCHALWTLGEFMKISTAVAQEHGNLLFEIACDTTRCVRTRFVAVDVWSSLHLVLRPCKIKEKGVDFVYNIIRGLTNGASNEDLMVKRHVFQCVATLILRRQFRDDRLHLLAILVLQSFDSTLVLMVKQFFSQYFRSCTAVKVSRLLFDIYFAVDREALDENLEGIQSSIHPVAVAVVLNLKEELVKSGFSQFDSFQTSLARECELPSRRFGALVMLEALHTSSSAIRLLLGYVERGIITNREQESSKVLSKILLRYASRCRDKQEKARIQDSCCSLQPEFYSRSQAQSESNLPMSIDPESIEKLFQI